DVGALDEWATRIVRVRPPIIALREVIVEAARAARTGCRGDSDRLPVEILTRRAKNPIAIESGNINGDVHGAGRTDHARRIARNGQLGQKRTPDGARRQQCLKRQDGATIHRYSPALNPPSMISADPVTNAASSLARYAAAAAISSGRPMRPTACADAISRYARSGSGYSRSRAFTNG